MFVQQRLEHGRSGAALVTRGLRVTECTPCTTKDEEHIDYDTYEYDDASSSPSDQIFLV